MDKDIKVILEDLKLKYGTDIANTSSVTLNDMVITLDTPLIQADNSLNGRAITVKDSITPFDVWFSGTIVSHDSTTITLSGQVTDTGSATVDIPKDTTIETECDNGIAKMDTANPKILTQYDFPTYNDMFSKYDDFTDVMIQFVETYQNEEQINTYIAGWNTTLNIDESSLSSSVEVQNYVTDLVAITDEADLIQDNVQAYFGRLKKLLTLFKIVDKRIASEDYLGMYNAKSAAGQTDMDTYYAYWLANGQNDYTVFKIQENYDIKIVV